MFESAVGPVKSTTKFKLSVFTSSQDLVLAVRGQKNRGGGGEGRGGNVSSSPFPPPPFFVLEPPKRDLGTRSVSFVSCKDK